MATPVWQILAKLDRIHELQSQVSPQSSAMLFGTDSLEDEEYRRTQAGPQRHELSPSNAQVLAATADVAESMRMQRVPVNVYEASEALMIVAPIPAVTADDVTIDLQQGSLCIHAALRCAPPRPYLIHEWEYGGFEGVVELPDGFGRSVEASLANGQLVVRVLRGQFSESISIHPTSPGRVPTTMEFDSPTINY